MFFETYDTYLFDLGSYAVLKAEFTSNFASTSYHERSESESYVRSRSISDRIDRLSQYPMTVEPF